MSSNVQIRRLDKLKLRVPLTGTYADGTAANVTSSDVAAIPRGSAITSSTAWMSATVSAGVINPIVAGPDADPTGALAILVGGSEIWVRVNPGLSRRVIHRRSEQYERCL